MITLHWQWLVFIPVVLILLYLIFRPREGGGYIDLSGFVILFWMMILAAFVLIWGGIFWW